MRGSRKTISFPFSLWVFLALTLSQTNAQEAPHSPQQPDSKTIEALSKWEEAYHKIQKLECRVEIEEKGEIQAVGKESFHFKLLKIKTQTGNKEYINLNNHDWFFHMENDTKNRKWVLYKIYYKSTELKSNIFKDSKKELEPYPDKNLFDSMNITIKKGVNYNLNFFFDFVDFLKTNSIKLTKEDADSYFFEIKSTQNDVRYKFTEGLLILSKSNNLPRRFTAKIQNDTLFQVDIKSINLAPTLELNDVLPPDNDKTPLPKIK